jgi:hypothetical protein
MLFEVSIDLKKLPLVQRNKVVDLVRATRAYYTLENQVISSDLNTMKKVMEKL